MATLYNAQTRQADQIGDFDQVEDAVKKGTHSFMKEDAVDVLDPNGDSYKIKGADLKDALDQGYKLETPQQVTMREYAKENGGLKGSLKAFGESALNEATFGIAEPIQRATDPIEAAKTLRLQEEHGVASFLGGAAGFGASLFYGGPLFKGAALAGKAAAAGTRVAEKALAATMVEHGVAVTTANKVAGTLLNKTVQNAAAMGVEGMVQMAPRAITEAAVTGFSLEGLEEGAETMFVGGLGVGAGLGLGLGALKGVSGLAKKAVSAVGAKLEPTAAAEAAMARRTAIDTELGIHPTEALAQAKQETKDALKGSVSAFMGEDAPDILKIAEKQGASPEVQKGLLDAFSEKKVGAEETVAARERLGLTSKPLDMQLYGSDLVSRVSSRNIEMLTEDGLNMRARVKQELAGVEKGAFEALGIDQSKPVYNPSAAITGEAIREKFTKYVEKISGGANGMYDAVNEHFPQIPIPKSILTELEHEIGGVRGLRVSPNSDVTSFYKNILEEIPKKEDLRDLKDFKTSLRDYFGESTSNNVKKAASNVYDIITNYEKKALEFHANEYSAEPETKKFFLDLLSQRKAADAAFRAGKEAMEDMAMGLGVKKEFHSSEEFIKFIEGKNPDDLTKAVLSIKDPRKMMWIKEKIPEAFQLAIEHKRVELLHAAKGKLPGVDGKEYINSGKLLSSIEDLTPELKAQVIKNPQSYQDAKTVFSSFSGRHINPSGTWLGKIMDDEFADKGWKASQAKESLGDMIDSAVNGIALKIPAIAQNIKKVQGVLATEKMMKLVGDKLDFIPKAVGFMLNQAKDNFKPALKGAVYHHFDEKDDDDEFKKAMKIKKMLQNLRHNPSDGLHADWKETVNFIRDQGAPNVASKYEGLMVKSMQYLDQFSPKPIGVPNPLKKEDYEPSKIEMAKFSRRVEAAMDPLSVIDRLADNTLTKEHIETVKALTPMLYARIQKGVMDAVSTQTETIPYQARLRLSALMEMPLDSSLGNVPQFQQTFQAPEQQKIRMPGLDKMQASSASQTNMQRLEGKSPS